jgi:DNA mismatch repair ATPase MutS
MEQRPQQPGDAKQHTPMMAQYLGHKADYPDTLWRCE